MMNAGPDCMCPSRRFSIALLVSSLAVAASAGASHRQPQDLKMEGYPAVGAPPIVTLLSPGAEPRTPLRYTITSPYTDHMSMTMATFSSMEMGGASMPEMQVPVMKIGLDLNVASVSPSGDISYAVAFSDMSVENAPGVNPAVLAAMQGLDSDIKTVTGTGTISDRGFVRSQAFDFSRLSNPVLKQTMDSLSAAMQNMSAPLPEEAVGVGARWEVRQSLAIGGLQTLQRVIFELVGLDAKTVTLKTRIETTAPPQVIRTPALPEWADVRLQQCTGSGTGKVTMRLDSLVPTSEATVQQDALMEISIGGTARTMRSATTMKVGISSVKQADPGTSAPEQKA